MLPKPHDYDEIIGDGQIDDVILVDQSPIGRSPRSNPVTYIKAFDQIRKVFTETVQAKTRNYKSGHFSFNVDGGRCQTCQGAGSLENRYAISRGRLYDLQRLQWNTISQGDPGGQIPGQHHCRRAKHDGAGSLLILPWSNQGPEPAQTTD